MKPKKTNNPKEKYSKPPFNNQKQVPPGSETKMRPQPDFGEETYKGCSKLKGKVALITGADSGIGRAIAVAYAKEGADIVFSYINESNDAKENQRVIKKIGKECLAIPGDITNENHCKALIKETLKKHKKLDILVNNAGTQFTYKSITQIPSLEFDKFFKTNIYAMFYLCKHALPIMKKGGV